MLGGRESGFVVFVLLSVGGEEGGLLDLSHLWTLHWVGTDVPRYGSSPSRDMLEVRSPLQARVIGFDGVYDQSSSSGCPGPERGERKRERRKKKQRDKENVRRKCGRLKGKPWRAEDRHMDARGAQSGWRSVVRLVRLSGR